MTAKQPGFSGKFWLNQPWGQPGGRSASGYWGGFLAVQLIRGSSRSWSFAVEAAK